VEQKTQKPTYVSSLACAAIAFLFAATAFGVSLGAPASNMAYYFTPIAFLLLAPALHVAGMVLAVLGIVRGFGRLTGFGCLLTHVLLIGLGVMLGAAALIGASA
jgi:hypothetical protein